jgi:hypothetical protein
MSSSYSVVRMLCDMKPREYNANEKCVGKKEFCPKPRVQCSREIGYDAAKMGPYSKISYEQTKVQENHNISEEKIALRHGFLLTQHFFINSNLNMDLIEIMLN